jgi:dipeptidyl-peptidase-4
MKVRLFLFLFLLPITFSIAQEKTSQITLEEIWKDYMFFPNRVPGFNFLKDGQHYSKFDGNNITKYDITTGKQVGTILNGNEVDGKKLSKMDGYTFSEDESKIVIETKSESIYRRSSKGIYYIYDSKSKALELISTLGKIQYPTLSPDATKVAFVFENNLYYKDLTTGKENQLTIDGSKNELIFGATDWVYEEEFSFAKAFWWAPDGQKIAYLGFDESEVKEFTMMRYNDDMYPEYETFKYPKVGEDNSKVYAFIYQLESEETVPVDMDNYEYIPRLKWTQDPNKLCIFKMNRWQNELELLIADAKTGSTSTLYKETSKYYVDIHDNLTFLKDGKHFVWTSEKSGFNHIYLHDMNGKEVRKITKGDWDVTAVYGVDEANGKVFYQSAEESPMQRYVYCVSTKGGKSKKLTENPGWNDPQFSSTFSYFVNNHSTANQPSSYTVFDADGKKVREIENNSYLRGVMKTYNVQPVEFFDFKTSEGVSLNGWMIKPDNFDEHKLYPVFMTEYGGPGSQSVKDNWNAFNYWWYQLLAQKGYIIACVDNRGTGARGEEFKKMTYLQLGKYETIDQIEAAKWLGKQSYVDQERIGIFGWSYGGYLSSLCILKGNDVFKSAIAVAPVTSWKWYDTVYTERYMRDTKENKDGYQDNSPVYFADRLKGNYLLIHGMADDNVHFQHSAEMAKALIAANKQFDTYYYPNKNHGISGGLTRLHLYTKMTNFLMDKL